nr:unnamed protein product [Callosobruchus analis]
MEDMKKLMPHHKPESKMERSKTLSIINEMCEMKNCNKAVLFEGRKKQDLYMWLADVPSGPSVKFLIENLSTMDELKLTGNCLRGSRPVLSFDPTFDAKPHYKLLKEVFTQIFGVPKHHPRSQPFFDHVYTFNVLDNRIWFRNYQILSEDGALAEVGPRFVLNPVKIFSGSFGGVALWENPTYMSPSKYRHQIRLAARDKYVHRVEQKAHAEATRPVDAYEMKPFDDIFEGDPLEKALQYETGENGRHAEKNTAPKKKAKWKKKLGNSQQINGVGVTKAKGLKPSFTVKLAKRKGLKKKSKASK